MPEINIKNLYNELSKTSNMIPFSEFRTTIQDSAKAREVYDGLSKKYNMIGFDDFRNNLRIEPLKPTGLIKPSPEFSTGLIPKPITTPPITTKVDIRPLVEPAIREREPKTLAQRVKEIIFKPFKETPTEAIARSQNIYAISKTYNLPINTVRKNYDNLTKFIGRETGLGGEPTAIDIAMLAPITAGLITAPLSTILGIATFAGISEIENAIVSKIRSEDYQFLAGKGLKDLLPEETNRFTRDTVEILDFMGKGLIAHGVFRKAPKIAEKFTKNIITEYKLPQKVYISPEKVADIFRTGKEISPQETSFIAELGLSGKQYRDAFKRGINIEIPAEKIVTISDKPYYAKIKSLFKLEPYKEVRVFREEKVIGKEPIAGLLEEKYVEVPKEKVTPVEPEIKKEISQKELVYKYTTNWGETAVVGEKIKVGDKIDETIWITKVERMKIGEVKPLTPMSKELAEKVKLEKGRYRFKEIEKKEVPEEKRPYPTTALFVTKDVKTGEKILKNEPVWYYPELKGMVKQKTHKSLFQEFQRTGKLFYEGELEKFKVKKPKEEIKAQEKLFEEKEPPLVKPTEPVKFHSGLSAIMPEIVQKKLNMVGKLFKEPEGIAKQSWDIVKDYWGKREGLKFEYQDKWNRTLRQKVVIEGKKTIFRKQKFKDKFSKSELEDAIFYRQKTGNIWKGKEDTFKDVNSRLPQDLKQFIDSEVNEHINNMRKWYNKAPFTKDIVAREEVIKTYLTGVYSGNIKKGYEYIVGLKGRQFVTNNFMLNKKSYLNFAEAFERAGLIPKFRNLADQLDYQDAYLVKLYSNNELISRIHNLEKEIKQKLVVRTNSKLYDEAKLLKDPEGKNLYVRFEDPYLRSYVAGVNKEGKLIWTTSRAPALVHRDLAGAIQSVFSKDAYKPENIFWRNYDRAGSFLRYIRVTFSGFHLVPLIESFVGGKGTSVLNISGWIKHGKKLLNDPIFMTEVKEAELRAKAPSEASRGQIEGKIKDLINRLEAQGKIKKVVGKSLKVVTAPQFRFTRFLFDEYWALLKVKMYYDYKHRMLEMAEKKNINLSEKQMKKLNRDIASTINDQFGGQSWEMIRYLNDPKVMKWMHRAVGYPDWSISALRQAGAIGEGGIRGRLARRYWLRYGIAFLATQQAISYLNTGLYNDEKGNIKWSWDKAHSTFENIDPSLKHKIDFQLPDIEIDLPIIGKFNPGRELKEDGTYGRRYYSHFGKQMLEIPRYVIKPIDQLFAKSNPVIQMVFKQIAGGAPYEGGIFPARGGYTITGEYKAWKGKWGREQLKERAIQLVKDATPFSIQSMWTTSPATAGVLPISKATSKYASQKIIEKAMRKGDGKKVAETVISLIDSNYEIKSIERMITTISNALLKEKILE